MSIKETEDICKTNGLTHKQSLKILFDQINDELVQFKKNESSFKSIVSNFLQNKSLEIFYNFFCINICAVFMFFINKEKSVSYINVIFLFIISLLNLTTIYYVHLKRSSAIYNRVKNILFKIDNCIQSNNEWNDRDFAQLYMPETLSITTQWTIRDGKCVNLPLSLVVEGDLIFLRPGHKISVNCETAVTDNYPEKKQFSSGQMYDPLSSTHKDDFMQSLPKEKKIPESIKCISTETPYIKYLKSALLYSTSNSDLLISNEFKKLHKAVMFYVIPIVMTLQAFIIIFYYTVVNDESESRKMIFNSILFDNMIGSMLPLLPISFTLFANFVKFYGSVIIIKHVKALKKLKPGDLHHYSLCDSESTLTDRDTNEFKDLLYDSNENADEMDRSSIKLSNISVYTSSKAHQSKLGELVKEMKESLMLFKAMAFETRYKNYDDENAAFIYSTDFFIGLGTMTNFSCVDKKGVLSWPNATAENIWLFKNSELNPAPVNNEQNNDMKLVQKDSNDDTSSQQGNMASTNPANLLVSSKDSSKLETLNLSSDRLDSFQVRFDDINWYTSISILKPLGLSILLNTCNKDISVCNVKYHDLLQIESDNFTKENDMIDVKCCKHRPCLCVISRLLKFKDSAIDCYRLIGSNLMYRNSFLDTALRSVNTNNSSSMVNAVKQQLPISNLISVIANYKCDGMNNLYSQGSADFVIDLCTDYWDGKEIKKFSASEKKKLFDVYQRHSVSSYCYAFSYKPLIGSNSVEIKELLDVFKDHSIKCPPLHSNIYNKGLDSASLKDDDFYETCSLNNAENNEKIELSKKDMAEEIFEMHSNQIFIGMVSMQYKAKIEVIKLVEKLTEACIRFVHFSSDNEQISRTFGEALGLDAGWNCHISLAEAAATATSLNETCKSSNSLRYLSREKLQAASAARLQRINTLNKSLPMLKIPSSLFGSQSLTVKFDLTNLHDTITSVRTPKKPANISKNPWSIGNENDDDESEINNSTIRLDKDHEKAHFLKTIVDDENLSHRTIHSGRTLSDAEILGNAARLPKGVETIRQHLENVDNVPLHVSLFTDSTKNTTKEMVSILQENGEIVCCFGSSHSIENIEVFSQANLAISIDPLYPQICMRDTTVHKWTQTQAETIKTSPIELSAQMHSINCGLRLQHDNLACLPNIMSTTRELVHSCHICLTFMLMCNLAICCSFLISNVLFLPPFLTQFQALSLIVFTIPMLSFSLIKNKGENQLRCTTKKNHSLLNKNDIKFFIIKFLLKFFPTICLLLLIHYLVLFFACKYDIKKVNEMKDNSTPHNQTTAIAKISEKQCLSIFMNIIDMDPNNNHNWLSAYDHISNVYVSQILCHFFLSFYFALSSINYVRTEKSIWQYVPFKDLIWTVTIIFVIIVNLGHAVLEIIHIDKNFFREVPLLIWIVLAAVWPVLLVVLNEITKVFEIKKTLRNYKKMRLEFDTKLGMNSPFV